MIEIIENVFINPEFSHYLLFSGREKNKNIFDKTTFINVFSNYDNAIKNVVNCNGTWWTICIYANNKILPFSHGLQNFC